MQAMREIDWNLLLVYGVKAGISSLPSWLEKREAQPIGNVEGWNSLGASPTLGAGRKRRFFFWRDRGCERGKGVGLQRGSQ